MSSHAGSFARVQIEQRRRAFRKHWPGVGAITLGLCLFSAGVLKVALGNSQVPAWVLGPVFVAAAVGALKTQLDGTYQLEAGIDAEDWTSKDLRRALGPRWYVVDGMSFGAQGDVDHVVVGPTGVFAIETKYSDSAMDSRTGRALVRSWIGQSHDNARRVGLLLKHNYGHPLEVTPRVIVSRTEFLTLPSEVEGTHVIRRRHLKAETDRWRRLSVVLTSEQVEEIRAALLDYRGLREDFERS